MRACACGCGCVRAGGSATGWRARRRACWACGARGGCGSTARRAAATTWSGGAARPGSPSAAAHRCVGVCRGRGGQSLGGHSPPGAAWREVCECAAHPLLPPQAHVIDPLRGLHEELTRTLRERPSIVSQQVRGPWRRAGLGEQRAPGLSARVVWQGAQASHCLTRGLAPPSSTPPIQEYEGDLNSLARMLADFERDVKPRAGKHTHPPSSSSSAAAAAAAAKGTAAAVAAPAGVAEAGGEAGALAPAPSLGPTAVPSLPEGVDQGALERGMNLVSEPHLLPWDGSTAEPAAACKCALTPNSPHPLSPRFSCSGDGVLRGRATRPLEKSARRPTRAVLANPGQ